MVGISFLRPFQFHWGGPKGCLLYTSIDSKIPEGPVAEKWTNYKAHQKLVNPANKRRLDIIVVGTCLLYTSTLSTK